MRDPDYEAEFLRAAETDAQHRFNIPTQGFQACVERRLRQGQELYGNAHQAKPVAQRALDIAEEAWDAAAYSVLDAEARLHGDAVDDHAAWHLFEIAKLAAAIHSHARYLMKPDDDR